MQASALSSSPASCTVDNWSRYLDPRHVESTYKTLLAQPLDSPAALREFLKDWSTLQCGIDEAYSRLGFEYYTHVTDTAAEKAVIDFEAQVKSISESFAAQARARVLACPHFNALPAEEFGLLRRRYEQEATTFHPKNIEIENLADAKVREYQNRQAAVRVEIQGKALTLAEIPPYMNNTDRAAREQIWRSTWAARLELAEANNDTMSALVELRRNLSANTGFNTVEDYYFAKRLRDYSPRDLEALAQVIERVVVPAASQVYEHHRKQLGVETLRPWDIGVGRVFEIQVQPGVATDVLSEFSPDTLIAKVQQVFAALHPPFEKMFRDMIANGDADFEARANKSHGAANFGLLLNHRSKMFMTPSGIPADVMTAIHETGHAFHNSIPTPVVEYLYLNVEKAIEIAELASMTTEALATTKLEAAFSARAANAIRSDYFASALISLPYIMQVHLYQCWLYEHPEAKLKERNQAWQDLTQRFTPSIDWSGLEKEAGIYWQQQHHLYNHPFYYPEYALAQLAAFKILNNYSTDPQAALPQFTHAISLIASQTAPEIFKIAGAAFEFSDEVVAPAIAYALEQWKSART